jgi:hypothetical protein
MFSRPNLILLNFLRLFYKSATTSVRNFFIATLLHFLQFFKLESYVFSFTNQTHVQQYTLRTSPVYEQFYTFWSKLIVMELVQCLTLIVLNAVIVWKIRQSRTFRKSFRNTQKQKVCYQSWSKFVQRTIN